MKLSVSISLLAIALVGCSKQMTLEESAEKLSITLPEASAMSVADVTAHWINGCDEAFKGEISVWAPSTEFYVQKDGESVPLSSLQSGIAIPWLTIYNQKREPVTHNNGYSSDPFEKWNMFRDGLVNEGPWPSLETVATYSDLDVSKIPDADFTFVKYSADWCAPCKAQSVSLKAFKDQNPNLKINHVEIIADTRNLDGKCPVEL